MYITTQYFTTSILGPAPTHWLSAVKIKRKVFTKMDRMFAHSLWVRSRNQNIYILYIHTYTHALHYIAWHCVPLHCIALHYMTLRSITLHCIALHCIALHYIALHTYTYTYIHVCIYIYTYIYNIYMYLRIHKYIPMTPIPPSKEVSETAVPLISRKPSKSGEFCRLRWTSPVKWEDRIR